MFWLGRLQGLSIVQDCEEGVSHISVSVALSVSRLIRKNRDEEKIH